MPPRHPSGRLPEQLPNGINGLQLQLLDPSDPTHLAAALDQVEARLGGLLPGLFQFSVGGSFPLTDPAFDLAGWRRFCAGSGPAGACSSTWRWGTRWPGVPVRPSPILRNFRFPSRRGIRPFMSNRDRAPGPSPTSDHAFAKVPPLIDGT